MTKRKPRQAPPAEKDEPMTEPHKGTDSTHKTTVLELATKVDAAVREESTRRQAVDVARVALEQATQEHSAAVATLHQLHTEYQTFMDNVLSVGGTVHVAKP